jgi:AcrR family transcriptional regulator
MAGGGTPESTPERDGDTVASATRALVDATSALSRLLGKQVSVASEEVGEAIAASLREAARGLADASASVEKVRAPHTSRGAQRRRERVDRTRADLLDAAGRVFAAQGFEGASVGDVAAAAGYTKGAVYAHFGSKSELFLTLARERMLCPDKPAEPPREDLAGAISRQLAASLDDPSTLLVLEVLAYAVRHPEARGELAGLFADSIDTLAGQVRDDRLVREPPTTVQDEPRATRAEPTAIDYDNALGVLAIANIAAVLAAISVAPDRSIDAGGRVVARLLKE